MKKTTRIASTGRANQLFRMPFAKDLESFFAANESRARTELFDLLRIPSVSARSEHNADTRRAAEWVADSLRAAGLTASLHQTKGHPIVVGEWRKAPPGAQTVMVYGHYDVQPAEPLELWDSPPFEPTVRDGKLYARGVGDDKGHIVSRLAAVRAIRAVHGELPCRVKFIIEGEEEIGSNNLPAFISRHRDLLRADGCIWEFGGVNYEGQ